MNLLLSIYILKRRVLLGLSYTTYAIGCIDLYSKLLVRPLKKWKTFRITDFVVRQLQAGHWENVAVFSPSRAVFLGPQDYGNLGVFLRPSGTTNRSHGGSLSQPSLSIDVQLPCLHALRTVLVQGKWSTYPGISKDHYPWPYPSSKWRYLPAFTCNLLCKPRPVRGKLAEITAAYGSKTIVGSITAVHGLSLR